MDIKCLIEKTVESFNHTESKSFQDGDTEVEKAIKNALEDFTFRTTEKIDKNFEGGVNALFDLLKKPNDNNESFVSMFEDYFNSDEKDETAFDNWHYDACKSFIGPVKKKYNVEYGKAQKIVNMTFKYLYCNNYSKKSKYDHCHIPLDSVILDWIWDNKAILDDSYNNLKIEKRFLKKYFDSWNNLKYDSENIIVDDKNGEVRYSYMFYQNLIREFCEGKECTPLQLEFLVWPQYQWERAAKEFYKQTENMLSVNNDKSKKTAKETLDGISELLNNELNLIDWKNDL